MLKRLNDYAQQAKLDIPALFIALQRPDTPKFAKLFALFTVSYALSPIDFIPDFIPVLGYLDDLVLLPVLAMLTIRLIPDGIFLECREEAMNIWQDGKPKKWFYGIPIVLFWLVVIFFIGRHFFPQHWIF